MAWFNFGKKDTGMNAKASVQKPVETVDAMRQRAKYRLIGAVVLVLAGVVGFPMLFDSQPRPVAVDMPIEIPDKAKVRPLGAAPVPSAPAPAAKVDDSASLSGKEEIVTPTKSEAKAQDKKPAAQTNNAQTASKAIAAGAAAAAAGAVAAGALKSAPDDKAKNTAADKATDDAAKTAAADKAVADKASADKLAADKARKQADEDKAKKLKAQAAEKAAADKTAEASRAKALLDGAATPSKPATPAAATTAAATTPAAAGDTRYIVQFGAFSDADKAQEARRKVEKVGLKTYSQIAKTPDGERIRVRVGPFTNKDEADKAAAKIKALDLPASILTL
jgi:DedD protein